MNMQRQFLTANLPFMAKVKRVQPQNSKLVVIVVPGTYIVTRDVREENKL